MFALLTRDPGKKLRIYMAEADLNVNELADLVEVSPSTISRLRTGQVTKPNRETAAGIANVLTKRLGRRIKSTNIWPGIGY